MFNECEAESRQSARLGSVVCYQVRHETRYRYSQAIERSEHWLRLRPVHDGSQTVCRHRISLSPYAPDVVYRDCFDNEVTYCMVHTPYQELQIDSYSEIVVSEPRFPGHIPFLGLGTYLSQEIEILAPYRIPDLMPESQMRELAHYVHEIVDQSPRYSLPLVIDAICGRIHQDFTYTPGATHFDTSAYETFCLKRGVCQDFSVLMINLLRLLQIPARYRTGYLYTGADQQGSPMTDASHAWVEAYLPRAGWYGWDPTLGRRAGKEHIRLACGKRASDATPTAGTLYSQNRNETLSARVSVTILDEVRYDL